MPEQLNGTFERLKIGVIGDMETYESQPPLFRLGIKDNKVTLRLRSGTTLIAADQGKPANELQFLFVLLWATLEKKGARIALTDLKELWSRLQQNEHFGLALRMHLPNQFDSVVEKFQWLYKKVNQNKEIKKLHSSLVERARISSEVNIDDPLSAQDRRAFIRLTKRSDIGAQAETWFPLLPVGELDWDDELRALIDRKSIQ